MCECVRARSAGVQRATGLPPTCGPLWLHPNSMASGSVCGGERVAAGGPEGAERDSPELLPGAGAAFPEGGSGRRAWQRPPCAARVPRAGRAARASPQSLCSGLTWERG